MVKSQKTSMMILFGSLVIVMLGFGIIIPLMPFYITHFGASGSSLGLMMAVYSIMQFLFAPFWGRLSDRTGRKPVLLIGVLGFALTFGLMGFAQSLTMLILARALAGVLSSAALPTAMAYIADITEAKDRSRGVGLMGAAMGMGMIFGPMLGGLLSGVHPAFPAGIQAMLQTTTDPQTGNLINLSLPFMFSGFLALLAIPPIQFLLPESLSVEQRSQARSAAKPGSRIGQLTGALRGTNGFLFLMAFLLAFAMANLEGVLGLYSKQQFRMGPTEIGLVMGALGVLGVIMQGVMIGPLTRRFGEVKVLKGGLLISMLGFTGPGPAALQMGDDRLGAGFQPGQHPADPQRHLVDLAAQQARAAGRGHGDQQLVSVAGAQRGAALGGLRLRPLPHAVFLDRRAAADGGIRLLPAHAGQRRTAPNRARAD